jgi:hypothetical protein
MTDVRQPSFSAGELAPTLWGRSDLTAHLHGLRTMKNFFSSKHGAAVSRPGTKLLGLSPSLLAPRMLKFALSESDSLLVEAGLGYFRFWKNGVQIESSPGVAYEVVYPTTIEQATNDGTGRRFRTAQSGNVLTITHPDNYTFELTRIADNNWTLTQVSYDAAPYTGTVPYVVQPVAGASATRPAAEWQFYVTMVMRRADGSGYYETAPYKIASTITFGPGALLTSNPRGAFDTVITPFGSDKFCIYPDFPLEIDFASIIGLAWGGADVLYATRIYRGRGPLIGQIGEVRGRTDGASGLPADPTFTGGSNAAGRPGRFIDYGQSPDYTRPPPQGFNPFKILDPADGVTVLRNEVPMSVAYFQGGLVYGGTNQRPGRIWRSVVNDFHNFDQRYVPTATSAIEFEIASRSREQIRSLVGLRQLLVFTSESVYSVGDGGSPLSAVDLIPTSRQSSVGASWLEPLVLPGAILYAKSKGAGVRDLSFSNESQGYTGGDITFFAQHLVVDQEITSWCYAEDPWGIVWAVRSDGKLLSLTYDRELGITAWAQHEVDGFVEDVCSIPEVNEDAVYLVIRRMLGGADSRYVVRMTSRVITDVKDAVCSDLAVTYSGAPATVISGLGHMEGLPVAVLADGDVVSGRVVSGGQITLDLAASKVHVGLPFLCDLELLDLATEKAKNKRVEKVVLELENSRGFRSGQDFDHLTEWRQPTVADGVGPVPLQTGTAEVAVGASWNRFGRAVVRQVDPLPVTVVAATRVVQGGG